MKWDIWLEEMRATPADDPGWDHFAAWNAAVNEIAAWKISERENARTSLDEALASLREFSGGSLAQFGWVNLEAWSSEFCSPTQSLRLMTHLNRLDDVLRRYRDVSETTPSNPQAFQAARQERNQLEDEIIQICGVLDAFFAAPEQNDVPPIDAATPEPEPEISEAAPPPAEPQNLQLTEEALPLNGHQSPGPQLTQNEPEATPENHGEVEPGLTFVDFQVNSIEPETVLPHSHAALTDPLTSKEPGIPGGATVLHSDPISHGATQPQEPPITEPQEAPAAHQHIPEPPPSTVETATATSTAKRRLKIFISSPGDVGQERVIATRVVERLQVEFGSYVELEPILWEHEPLRATSHFQDQIMAPSLSDIVVCILWSRLGTRLPGQFKRDDGSHYASGTEWEFEDAMRSYQERGTPDLVVYRKSAEPHASMSDEQALLDRLAQKRALDNFIDRWFGNPTDSFKAAFHQFHAPDEFEQILESHLRSLISERLPKHITDDDEARVIRWHHGSPFRGLETFSVEHAPIFYGRTRAISEVCANIISRAHEDCAFQLVFGMSGSGKSSMVTAGLLPTLIQPGVVEGVGMWRWTILNPSDARDPIYALAAALLEADALPELKDHGLNATELTALLREAPQHVLGPLKAALQDAAESTALKEKWHQVPTARLAVVVDQMEELFTHEGLDPADRERFVAILNVLARSGVAWVVATMRSDFFVRCAEIPELMELKDGRGQYHLLPPTFAELSQIVIQPARIAGLRFEVDPATGDKLSDVLQEAAGKDPGALPLVEFTLDELFKRRTEEGVLTFEAYNALGGVEGALGQRAEDVFQSLPLVVQDELPAVLRALVTVSESVDSGDIQIGARRAPLAQLAANEARHKLIEAFVAARLLIVDHPIIDPGKEVDPAIYAGQGIVRVAHEALLRHWPRLQKWLAEDLEFLRTRTRVMSSAAQWTENQGLPVYLLHEGRPLAEAEDLLAQRHGDLEPGLVRYIQESRKAARRARNLRLSIVTVVLVAFFGVVAGFGSFSFIQWQRSESQKKLAMAAVNKWTYEVPEKLAPIAETRPVLKTIFQENIKLLSDIDALSPNTGKVQREKAANLDRMGDTWMLLGDSKQARDAYDQSLAILTSLANSEGTASSKRDLATSLEKIGDTRQVSGDLAGAGAAFEKSLKLRRDLAASNPGRDIERELSVSYEKIGGLQRQRKQFAACYKSLEQAWQIRSKIAAQTKDKESQRDLFVCAVSIGDAYMDEGKTADARKAFEQVLNVGRERAKSGDADARRDLSALYDRLGDIQIQEGNAPAALKLYRQSLVITQDLAEDHKDAQSQRDLLTSWNRMGNIYLSSGDAGNALKSFARALPLAEALAGDRDNLDAQQALMDVYIAIGDSQQQLNSLMLAHAAYMQALRQYDAITSKWPNDTRSRTQAANAHGQLSYLKLQFRQPRAAVTEATQGLALAPDQHWIAVNLVHGYVFSNQLARAKALCLKNQSIKIQGVPFNQVVLDDMERFSAAGLTNRNMPTLQKWLLGG